MRSTQLSALVLLLLASACMTGFTGEAGEALSTSTPIESEEPLPDLIQGQRLVDAPVSGLDSSAASSSGSIGVVRDFFLEPTSGEILGVVIRQDEPGAVHVVQGSSVHWTLDEDGVRAQLDEEALEPGPLGELDYESLFDGRSSETLTGEVTAIPYMDPDSPCHVILKLHDAGNLLHRVYLGNFGLLSACLPELRVGSTVTFEALPTRDGVGKLWIATRIEQGGVSLRLLAPEGVVLGESLSKRLPSALGMAEVQLESEDGGRLKLQGWALDWRKAQAVSLLVSVDGGLRSVPWSQVEVDPGGSWKLLQDEEGLRSVGAAEGEVSQEPRSESD